MSVGSVLIGLQASRNDGRGVTSEEFLAPLNIESGEVEATRADGGAWASGMVYFAVVRFSAFVHVDTTADAGRSPRRSSLVWWKRSGPPGGSWIVGHSRSRPAYGRPNCPCSCWWRSAWIRTRWNWSCRRSCWPRAVGTDSECTLSPTTSRRPRCWLQDTPNNMLQQTGHANDGFLKFSALPA